MTWKAELTNAGRSGDVRIRYSHEDDKVRFFLMEPGKKGVLDLVFTRVYSTIAEGMATAVSDYNASKVEPEVVEGDGPRCAFEKCRRTFERRRYNQRYCSDICKHRADSLKSYYRRKQESA